MKEFNIDKNGKMGVATCPICKKIFRYVIGFKPQTCGEFDCLYKMAVKKLGISSEIVT